MRQFSAEIPLGHSPFNLRVIDADQEDSDRDRFLADVVAGLRTVPKALPPKYFYDRNGAELFETITTLPEYYLTRTEVALLRQHAVEMAEIAGRGAHVIEFGSGASHKVRILLKALNTPASYVGVDVSRAYLVQATQALAADYPDMPVVAVCADFTRSFRIPPLPGRGIRLGFFPGSTIGNLSPEDAVAFLRHAAKTLQPGGGIIVGVDLKKEPDILHAAYNDARGVTAAFNMNLLTRINRELGGTFDPRQFAHVAFYNCVLGRVEMHLRSRVAQSVTVGGNIFSFDTGESIHTESSYKYDIAEFQMLARHAGFRPARVWVDADRLFSLHYLAVPR